MLGARSPAVILSGQRPKLPRDCHVHISPLSSKFITVLGRDTLISSTVDSLTVVQRCCPRPSCLPLPLRCFLGVWRLSRCTRHWAVSISYTLISACFAHSLSTQRCFRCGHQEGISGVSLDRKPELLLIFRRDSRKSITRTSILMRHRMKSSLSYQKVRSLKFEPI